MTTKLLLIKITINIQDKVALQNQRRVIVRSASTSLFHWGRQYKLVTTKLIILRVLWILRQIIHPAPTLAFRPGKQCLLTITTLLQCPLQKLILPLWECLTAVCKALSLANAKGKGTDGLVIRS